MTRKTRRPILRAIVAVALLAAACGGRDAARARTPRRFSLDTARSEPDGRVRESARLRTVGKEGPDGAAGTTPVILSFDCLGDNAITTIITDQGTPPGSVEARLTLDANAASPRFPALPEQTPSGGQVVLTMPRTRC